MYISSLGYIAASFNPSEAKERPVNCRMAMTGPLTMKSALLYLVNFLERLYDDKPIARKFHLH